MDLTGNDVKEVINYDASIGYIWGLKIKNNRLIFPVSRDKWEYGIEDNKSFIFHYIPNNSSFKTGNTWVVVYNSNGSLDFLKKYSIDEGYIILDDFFSDSFMKIMHWNNNMTPLCDSTIVLLSE